MNLQYERYSGNYLYPDVTPLVQLQTNYSVPVQPSSSFPAVQPSVPLTAPAYERYNSFNYDNTSPVFHGAQNLPPSSESSYYPTSSTKQELSFKNPSAYCIGDEAHKKPESFQFEISQQPTSHVSQILYCPSCKRSSQSTVCYHISINTYIGSGICCVLGCWPCCLIPFFNDSCQRAEHSCPTCHHVLGADDPF